MLLSYFPRLRVLLVKTVTRESLKIITLLIRCRNCFQIALFILLSKHRNYLKYPVTHGEGAYFLSHHFFPVLTMGEAIVF